VYLSIEVEAEHKIYQTIEQSDDVLINVNGSCVQPCNENPNCQQDKDSEETIHKGHVDFWCILHAIHYDIVRPEERYDIQMITWSSKVKHAIVSINLIYKPEGTPIFVEHFKEGNEIQSETSEDRTLISI